MKKDKRDNLTDLIHSLTVNEKRYFKLSPASRANSNHKKLFDALDGLPMYDAKRVKKKLGKIPMNISYEKNYLQRMVLRSMRNYSEDTSVEMMLHRTLIEIELLYNKELIVFCYQVIEKTLAIAEKHELFLYQLHLLKWKRSCLLRLGDTKLFTAFLKAEGDLISNCLNKLSNLSTYKTLQQNTYSLISNRGTVLQKEDEAALQVLMSSPHLKNIAQAHTIHAKALFWEVKIWCSHILNQWKNAYKYSKQLVALIDGNMGFIQLNPQAYMASLATHYNRCYMLDYFDEATLMLEKMEQLKVMKGVVLPEGLKREIFYFLSERRLMEFAYAFQFEKAIEQAEINRITCVRKKMKLRPVYFLLQYYFTALSHFHLRQYDLALKFLRKIINEFDDSNRLDFILFSHVLHLLTQFELGSYELIPYLSKSLQRFMKSRKIERNSVELVLTLLNKIVKNHPHQTACADLYKSFKNDLEKEELKTTESILSDTIMLKLWVASKVG